MHGIQSVRPQTRRIPRKAIAICGIILGMTVTGCGRSYDDPRVDVYPVKGKVTLKGKPLDQAEVVLISEDPTLVEQVRPKGRTSEDGTFTLWTYEKGDGAPSGKYKAIVTRNLVVTTGGSAVSKPNDLPKKYASPTTTDLIVEIGNGPTDIPTLELK